MRRIIPLLFGLIFLAVGIGLSLWGLSVLSNAKASTAWPTVQGTVTSSEVNRESKTRRTNGRSRRSTTYSAEVSYTYQVEGAEYSANRVSFGEYSSSNASHAQSIVSRFPAGKEVPVHYNPEDPSTAVLEAGVSWSSYIPLGLGAIFSIVGLIVVAALFFGRSS